jgi:hypothetical protein
MFLFRNPFFYVLIFFTISLKFVLIFYKRVCVPHIDFSIIVVG